MSGIVGSELNEDMLSELDETDDDEDEKEQQCWDTRVAYMRRLNSYTYDFIKTYLYALYQGVLKHKDIKISAFHVIQSYSNPMISPPSLSMQTDTGLVRINNDIVHVFLKYYDREYYIYINRHHSSGPGGQDVISYHIGVYCEKEKETKTEKLIDEIYILALNNSIYKGKILRIFSPPMMDTENMEYMNVEIQEEQGKVNLDDIFIPDDMRKDIRKFVECVKRHEELKIPLKYLMSGPPGTAKTMITRAIASACEGKATILLASGNTLRPNMVFNFAELFTPCIVCIDDIDLSVGDRRHSPGEVLNAFLQRMDGFVRNNVFVLATTNDKKLVDIAASRPGRFDLVMDVGALGAADYLNLVRKQTDDESIVNLFTPAILTDLKEKKIVGAFIVNLVKHVLIEKKTNGHEQMTGQDLKVLVEKMYKGFYVEPGKGRLGFGVGKDE